MIIAALPSIDWANLSIGVAALVVLLIVLCGLGFLVWKFAPQITEAWQALAKAIDGMATAVSNSTDVIDSQHRETKENLNRIERGVDRIHERMDSWRGQT